MEDNLSKDESVDVVGGTAPKLSSITVIRTDDPRTIFVLLFESIHKGGEPIGSVAVVDDKLNSISLQQITNPADSPYQEWVSSALCDKDFCGFTHPPIAPLTPNFFAFIVDGWDLILELVILPDEGCTTIICDTVDPPFKFTRRIE